MNIDAEKLAKTLALKEFRRIYEDYDFEELYTQVDDSPNMYLREGYAEELRNLEQYYFDLIDDFAIDE